MRNEKEHPVAQAIISITVHHGNLDHTAGCYECLFHISIFVFCGL